MWDGATDRAAVELARQAGFDFVRLPFPPAAVMNEDLSPRADGLARLMATALETRAEGLAVILDLHPPDAFRERLFTDPAAPRAFIGFWRAAAEQALALGLDDGVYFELLNEPGDFAGWWQLQGAAIAAIRSVDKGRPMVASGDRFSRIERLVGQVPYGPKNIVYSFHFYDPMGFTHQGATWGSGRYADLRGVPYPVPSGVPGVGAARWDAGSIEAALAPVARWARRHGVRVLCGEFGVYKGGGVDPAHRLAYLRDARTAMERLGIAWALWELQEGFGIAERGAIDPGAAAALGLP